MKKYLFNGVIDYTNLNAYIFAIIIEAESIEVAREKLPSEIEKKIRKNTRLWEFDRYEVDDNVEVFDIDEAIN